MKLSSLKPSHWKTGMHNRIIRCASHVLSDEQFIKFNFRLRMGYPLNLDNPKTFNEKLNWLKLNDHNPLYTKMADKYDVKKYVKERIGEEYVVPCLGVWNNLDDMDFDTLKYPCVLKATNDSSGTIICRSRDSINPSAIRKRLSVSMKRNWYAQSREWVYKDIEPRIIADEFLDDGSGHELRDYKFWCFNGEPRYMYVTNKAADVFENFYDMDFKPVDINHGFKRHVPEFECPDGFDMMKSLCKRLLEGIDVPFVRIDFFYVKGKIYFGEFTFYDWGGMRPFSNTEWDYKLGEYLKLPINK